MQSNVNLRSDFQNVPLGLKFDRNGPNNIQNRLNLLSRPYKSKANFGSDFQNALIRLRCNRNDSDESLNRLDLLNR